MTDVAVGRCVDYACTRDLPVVTLQLGRACTFALSGAAPQQRRAIQSEDRQRDCGQPVDAVIRPLVRASCRRKTSSYSSAWLRSSSIRLTVVRITEWSQVQDIRAEIGRAHV